MNITSTSSAPLYLFGGSKPWLPPPWTPTDDRLRGGSSRSHLSALPNNSALFLGHLDTKTLGGAGFASQFREASGEGNDDDESSWDLSVYDGVEIRVGKGDGKVYTLILKDENAAGKRDDGREKAGISWEAEFRVEAEGGGEKEENVAGRKGIWVPWGEFTPMYRGRERKDAGKLKTGEVRKVGFMMRSFFGTQEGDFRLELRSVVARRKSAEEEGGEDAKLSAEKGIVDGRAGGVDAETWDGEGMTKGLLGWCAIL